MDDELYHKTIQTIDQRPKTKDPAKVYSLWSMVLSMVKILIPLGLIVFFAVLIAQEWGPIQKKMSRNFFIDHIRVEREKVQSRARVTTLNHLMPDSYAVLMKLVENDGNKDGDNLQPYVDYYEKIVEYIPANAEAYAMLGFCYYYQGRMDESIAAYRKAAALNPHFFWSHYDLGLVLFKRNRFSEAAEVLQNALNTRPENTLKELSSSQVYLGILKTTPGLDDDLTRNLENAYRDGYVLLGLSLKALGQNEAAQKTLLQAAALSRSRHLSNAESFPVRFF